MDTYRGGRQLDALGDESRRSIVVTLSRQGPLPVARLAEQLPISRPAVSQHLKVLASAGLVTARAEGTRRVYALDDSGLADLREFFSSFWRQDLEDFAAHVCASLAVER